jgi:TolB-like protein
MRVYRVRDASTAAKSPATLPDKPSIAVLPFANISGDREEEYFIDGMVEEIITALSRIRRLFVFTSASSGKPWFSLHTTQVFVGYAPDAFTRGKARSSPPR